MQLTRDSQLQGNIITGVADDCIKLGQRTFGASLILSADDIVEHWPVTRAIDLRHEHWSPVIALEPELIVLGTGRAQVFPTPESLAPLYDLGLGLEIMSTSAACRTYNILVQENRQVVAALILDPH